VRGQGLRAAANRHDHRVCRELEVGQGPAVPLPAGGQEDLAEPARVSRVLVLWSSSRRRRASRVRTVRW
jgi:hypothetical protein